MRNKEVINNEKTYENVKVEIMNLTTADIITSSGFNSKEEHNFNF